MADAAPHGRILVVDDDKALLKSISRVLKLEGFDDILSCSDPREVHKILSAGDIDVILLDLVMPDVSGEELLPQIVSDNPEIPVIIVTATDQVDTAVRCIKAGAFDFLVKPVDFSRLITGITRAVRQKHLADENRALREQVVTPALHNPEHFSRIITCDPAMQSLFRYVEAIAASPDPVVIVGETGTGKELVAEALHRAGGYQGKMVPVGVASLNENVFADTLFGHVAGAFAGADRDRPGMIERAEGGTLFLDEIGDLSIELQTNLLRLVDDSEYFPLGSDASRNSTCRIVAATSRDLRRAVMEGAFREDLYFRLFSHPIRIPPLRERLNDLPLLVEHFIADSAATLNKTPPSPPRELVVHLSAYSFPGNVRELRAMILDAVACHRKGILPLSTFQQHMDHTQGTKTTPGKSAGSQANISFGQNLPTADEVQQTLIAEALTRTRGNQAAAARLLGISRRTVNRFVSTK